MNVRFLRPSKIRILLLLVACAGWVALGYLGGHLALPAQCGISLGHWLDWGWDGVALLVLLNPPEEMLCGWVIMVAAMMLPLLALPQAAGRLRDNLRFLAVYFSLWTAAGVVLITLAVAISLLPGKPLVYGLLLAGLWQLTGLKLRSLRSCHACSQGGVVAYTLACIGACWTWMLLPLLVQENMHFMVMLIATALMAAERFLITAKWRAAAFVSA